MQKTISMILVLFFAALTIGNAQQMNITQKFTTRYGEVQVMQFTAFNFISMDDMRAEVTATMFSLTGHAETPDSLTIDPRMRWKMSPNQYLTSVLVEYKMEEGVLETDYGLATTRELKKRVTFTEKVFVKKGEKLQNGKKAKKDQWESQTTELDWK